MSALGYVPNLVAGGLRSARSHVVTALVPTLTGPLFGEMVQALTDALELRGFQVMVGQVGYARSREDALLRAIVGRRPDGIVLTGVMHSPEGRRLLMASGIPVVETWDLTPTPIDMLVGFSHLDIGRAVAQFFVAKGRKRLALVTAEDERAARRAAAFAEAAEQAGLPPVHVVNVGAQRSLRSGRDALARLVRECPEADAVFCSSDLLAVGVATEARARQIAVPGRLAIMGFGDVPFVADMLPALSTVQINGAHIGRLAAQYLMDRAEGREVDPAVVQVDFSIVERDTT